jgi:hypothetical protein
MSKNKNRQRQNNALPIPVILAGGESPLTFRAWNFAVTFPFSRAFELHFCLT